MFMGNSNCIIKELLKIDLNLFFHEQKINGRKYINLNSKEKISELNLQANELLNSNISFEDNKKAKFINAITNSMAKLSLDPIPRKVENHHDSASPPFQSIRTEP